MLIPLPLPLPTLLLLLRIHFSAGHLGTISWLQKWAFLNLTYIWKVIKQLPYFTRQIWDLSFISNDWLLTKTEKYLLLCGSYMAVEMWARADASLLFQHRETVAQAASVFQYFSSTLFDASSAPVVWRSLGSSRHCWRGKGSYPDTVATVATAVRAVERRLTSSAHRLRPSALPRPSPRKDSPVLPSSLIVLPSLSLR